MAMKDESQLTLQAPTKDPTSLKPRYDATLNVTNGVTVPEMQGEDPRPKRNHVNSTQSNNMAEGREESEGMEGSEVSSVEVDQATEIGGEDRVEGPTTRFV